jgi:flavin reductase (DIM6/NTAB) family NADH-FMN oxidoreductase RutF
MTNSSTVDALDFRNAMARFASGVTVVATHDASGKAVAFTASAFSSLSLDPPLILVCLERRADSFPAFEAAEQFTVSILAAHQADHGMHFAAKSADKFAGISVDNGTMTGMPLLPDALVHLECRVHQRLDGGDHVIILGEVLRAQSNDQEPLLHFNRRFGRFQPQDA